METIINTIIYLILGFIGGYSCRVLFDRRSDDRALQGIRSARDINSQLNESTGEIQRGVDSVKTSVERAEGRAGEMEEESQRIAEGTDKLIQSAERTSEHIEQAKGDAEAARERVGKIRKLLAKAKKRS